MSSEYTQQSAHRRQQRRILPALLLVIGLVIVANGLMVWQEREQFIAQSAQSQQSLVNSMAGRLQITMQKISTLTTQLSDDLIEFPERVARDSYRERLHRIQKDNPDIDVMAIITPDGDPIACSLPIKKQGVNFRDRPYFEYHQTHPGTDLMVWEPVISRANGKRVIPVTRRIVDRQGKFAGVVNVTVTTESLTGDFNAVNVGPHGFIAVDHVDGHILARLPADSQVMSRNMRGTAQYDNNFSKKSAGSFTSLSPIDGWERHYTFKRLDGYPLIMITGVANDDLMASWMTGAVMKAGYVIAMSALLSLVALFLYKKLGRLEQAEAETQAAFNKSRAYQIALDDFVIVVLMDRRGVVLEVNDRFCALSGFARDELVGRPLPMLDGRIDDPKFSMLLHRMLEAGVPWRGMRMAQSKQGDKLWLSACLLPLPRADHESQRFLLAQVDFTSLRVAEEQMEKTHEALQDVLDLKFAILNSASCAIVASDVAGRIVMFNQAAEQLLGYASDEVVGKVSPTIFHDPDQIAAAMQTTLPATLLAGVPYVDLVPLLERDPRREWAYRCRDGSATTVQVRVSPLRSSEGLVRGHVTVVTDLTQQKQLDQMKSDFVSVVSHELRTPLTSIKGALSLVNASLRTVATPQQTKLMGMASDNCDRLVRLVSDILDLDKLARGQMPLYRSMQPLRPLLEKAVLANEPYALQSQVRYCLTVEDESLVINVDEDRFLQVMTNLLSNACKFSLPGSEVRVRASVDAHEVVIAVEDDGAGIPKEFHTRVFERFTQSESAGTRKKGGSGLGLSIARGFVHAHGGTLNFESTEAVGTTFFVRLPVSGVTLPMA